MKVASLEFDLLANIARLQQDMTKAQQIMGRSLNAMEQSIQRTMNTFNRLGGAFAMVLGGSVADKILEMADDWGQYASRMKMATQSTAEYERAQARMMQSAQATFRPINETREAFINLSPVLRDMGMTLDQSIDAVDAFSGLLVTAGANAQRGEAAMNALSKSLQKGKVDANSWATIYTTADGILEHLVATTGKSADELRRLGAEGKLSATQLANALTNAYGPVMEQVENMPTTVADAMTNMRTSLGEYIGSMNEGLGVTNKIADGITLLADNMDLLMVGIGVLSAAALPALIGKITALTVAIAANPIGLLAVAIAASIAYLISLRDEVNKFGKEMDAFGAVWDMIKGGFVAIWEVGKSAFDNIMQKVSGSTEGMEVSFDSAFMAITGALDTFHGAVFGSFAALEALWNTTSHNLAESFSFAFNKIREVGSEVVHGIATSLNEMLGTNYEVSLYIAPSDKPDLRSVGDAMAKAFNEHKSGLGLQSIYKTASDARKMEREIKQLEQWYNELSEESDGVTTSLLKNSEALDKNKQKLTEAQKAAKKFAEERLAAFKDQAVVISNLHKEAQALEDQVKYFGQNKRALEALEIARLRERATLLAGFEGSKEQIALIEQEIEARERLLQAGFTLEALENGKKAADDLAETAKRTHDDIEKSLTDALLRGFESGKGFGRNFIDTLKNMFSSLVLRPIIQPIAAGAAGMITGALGFGGAANAKGGQGAAMGFDVLRGAHSAYSAFTGGLTSTLSNGIGYLGEMFGSSALSSFASGMSGAAVSSALASAAGSTVAAAGLTGVGGSLTIGSGVAASLGTSAATGSALGGMAGAGAMLGAAMPWITGGLAIAALIPTISNMFKGETRSGGGFVYDPALKQASFHSGPSGGYGGAQTESAITQLFGSTVDIINSVIADVGAQAEVAFFHGAFESSKKGRGGVFSGGDIRLADGSTVGFGGAKKGDGYGGTSGSPEQMIENLQKDMYFSVLEAWQSVSDQMPNVLQSMLKDIDVRSLSAEQAQASVQQIQMIVGAVGQLSLALSQLPMTNLQELAFEVKAGLNELFGGADQAIAGIGGYYQNFYSEAERTAHTIHLLTAEFGKLGYELPASRDALRDIVDGIDLSTREGQELYVQLLQLAPTFASVTEEAGGFGLALGELGELMQLLSSLPFNHLREMGEDTVRVLADLSGGVEAFSHNLSAYYQGFFSEQERFVSASALLVTDLSDLGLSLPATASGFRAMMDSIDLTTQAGQELFAALLGTADQAVSHYQYVEQQVQGALAEVAQAVAQARQAELTELKASQNQRLQALREEQKKATQAVRDSYAEQVKSVRDSIGTINDKLRELGSISNRVGAGIEALRSYSDLAVELHRNASRKLVDEAVRLAQAGQSLVGFTGLEDAISAVSRLEASDFTSLFEFELERAETVNRLKELESLTGGQIDVQELQLSAMEKQLENLDEWRDKQFSLLENQFERRQQTLESIFQKEQDALNQHFEALLKQEQEAVERQVTEMLTMQANQAALGHIVESTSLQQYSQLVSIESAIDASASRIASAVSNIRVTVDMGLPAFADGGHYGGGLALVGERGPEIINFSKPGMVYTAAQSKSLMASGADNSEVAVLLRQLIGEIKEMRYELRQVATNTQKTNRMLDDVTQGGTTLRTEVFNGAN